MGFAAQFHSCAAQPFRFLDVKEEATSQVLVQLECVVPMVLLQPKERQWLRFGGCRLRHSLHFWSVHQQWVPLCLR